MHIKDIKDVPYSEAWVEFVEGERYLIRFLSAKKIAKLEKEYLPRKPVEFEDACFDHVIKDWEGITVQVNGKAEKLPCTKENKALIVDHYAERKSFLRSKALDDGVFGVPQPKEIEKNLSRR